MRVDVLPDDKGEEGEEAENEHCYDFWGFPTCGWPFPSTLLVEGRTRMETWTYVKAPKNMAIPITVNTVPR
jgi:hypothetical protein